MSAIVRTTFPFPYYTYTTRFNDNVKQIQFGNGFTFASQPSGPPQRSFKLRMSGMAWHRQPEGGLDVLTARDTNLGRLEEFYKEVECWKPFIWQHPIYGNMLVRFLRPLDIPYQIPGGTGVVEPFELEFIEVTSAASVQLIPDVSVSILYTEDFAYSLNRENGIPLRTEQ